MRKYATEFLGTFIFLFAIVAAVNTAGALAPLAIGATLMVMIYAGGHISGGHFNPAVSLAALIRGGFEGKDLLPYWVAQIVGGVLGALLGGYVTHMGHGAVALSGAMILKALIAEFVITFALCWIVLNTATSKDTEGNSFYGLAIGFIVVAGAFAVGSISGGAFNPAVAIGVTVAKLSAWGNLWILVVADLLGGVAAGYAFKALRNPIDK